VQEGQVVITDTGTRMELALPNGEPLSVAAGRELLIDANLLGTAPQDRTEAALQDLNSGAAQVARVIAAGGDLSTELDPTAAGLSGGDGSESHSFVRVLRIDESLSSLDQASSTTSSQEVATTLVESTPNQAPIAADDALSATEDTPLVMTLADLTGNDSDPDGDRLSIISVQAAVHGTVVLDGGNVVFTPAANYNGPASFSYTLSDGRGGTDTATVNLTVGAVNDAPVATDDLASTTPEELAANWQRVAQHFDLLLDRPEAIDALEQTLLQLAVRGLLVPQDPADEPAGALLARITTERTSPTQRVKAAAPPRRRTPVAH